MARFLLENLYSAKHGRVLDPRFYFLIHTKTKLWLWIGANVPKANTEKYMEVGQQMARLLQEHERASKKLITVHQGEEGSEFWAEFQMS